MEDFNTIFFEKTNIIFDDFYKKERQKHIALLYVNFGIKTSKAKFIIDKAFEEFIIKFNNYDPTKSDVRTYFNGFIKYSSMNNYKKTFFYDDIFEYEMEDVIINIDSTRINLLYNIIFSFPEKERNFLLMKYRLNFKVEKIAIIYGINYNTMRCTFKRMHEKIIKKYSFYEIKYKKYL